MLKVKKVNKFDDIGQEVQLDFIKKNILKNLNYTVELSEKEKVIKLNIPFSEIFHKCTAKEWNQILE
jgi:hypothetical protein